MIPEPCKYTPDVSFVNATFFNISAFVNSWKRCQPCFNGAQKRTAFKEMAHHFSSQNYKCCQKASFSLYWLAPGKTALCIAPSYVPLPADVSLQAGKQRETWSSQGCPGEGRGQSPAEPDVPPQPPWTGRWSRKGCGDWCSQGHGHYPLPRGNQRDASTFQGLGSKQSTPFLQALIMLFEEIVCFPAAHALAAWSSSIQR